MSNLHGPTQMLSCHQAADTALVII